MLRKPGKPRYDNLKVYCPITLLNTLGKLLMAIIAEQLKYYTGKHALLLPTHFGRRPGRTMMDALHTLMYRIKDVWHKLQVVLVLFLDIEGAFPNCHGTISERLLYGYD